MKKMFLIVCVVATHNPLVGSCGQIIEAVNQGNPSLVRHYLPQSYDPNTHDYYGKNALYHLAAHYRSRGAHSKDDETLTVLLADKRTQVSQQIVQRACHTGQASLVSALLKKYAEQHTAFFSAQVFLASCQHSKNMQLLAVGIASGILAPEDITPATVRNFLRNNLSDKKVAQIRRSLLRTTVVNTTHCRHTPSNIFEKEEKMCSVCLTPLESFKPEKTLACSHTFHLECVKRWFERTDALGIRRLPSTCPTCRCQADAIDHAIDIGTLR